MFVLIYFGVTTLQQHGSTPFHWAAANCHMDVLRALLGASAQFDVGDNVRLQFYCSIYIF
jgi:ankyrin repeat protein